jgi:hypothetical protein
MPFPSFTRHGGRLLGAAVAAALLVAAPAPAAGPANPLNCVPEGATSQVFSAYGDLAQYAMAPGGDMEDASGWTLANGAEIVAAEDGARLHVPGGGTAVSGQMCIDETYPYFRLFARNGGNKKGALKVDVLYLDAKGNVKATKAFSYRSDNTWALTDPIYTNVFTKKVVEQADVVAAPVAFRFSAEKGTDWELDDLYVDPWARR